MTLPSPLDELTSLLRPYLDRAHVPYSGRPSAAAVLLSDGSWVPGVRVESASFGLTIPAIVNAFTTAYAAGRRDIVAAVHIGTEPVLADTWLRNMPVHGAGAHWERLPGGAWSGIPPRSLPAPGETLNPFLGPEASSDIQTVRGLATRAWIPESDFPVACILRVDDGRLLPGVNVEHPDWTGVLCAERNALGTAVTFGCPPVTEVVLSCPDDLTGTPCGACRQLLAEYAPNAAVRMDRGAGMVEESTPELLLPGAFRGEGLRH